MSDDLFETVAVHEGRNSGLHGILICSQTCFLWTNWRKKLQVTFHRKITSCGAATGSRTWFRCATLWCQALPLDWFIHSSESSFYVRTALGGQMMNKAINSLKYAKVQDKWKQRRQSGHRRFGVKPRLKSDRLLRDLSRGYEKDHFHPSFHFFKAHKERRDKAVKITSKERTGPRSVALTRISWAEISTKRKKWLTKMWSLKFRNRWIRAQKWR